MASNSITSTLQYRLVNHPQILNFTWTQNQTPASSPHFLILSILTYLSLTFLLYHTSTSTSPPPSPLIEPHILKPITAVHNLILLLLSLVMAVGCTLSIVLHSPDLRHILCFPPTISPSGPLFFYAYIFYLSKILEFLDTLLIILSNSIQRLTFLHVYHHATVVVMCYLWLQTKQSLFPIALVTNASVHVIMYGYYLLCVMGLRPKWKRLVTDCQIVQFVFSFVVSVLMLYYHFTGFGCSGVLGWCFNVVFNASLLTLFVNFHSKSYAKKKQG
ncbi:Very-long-chain 3-oxoacyl-CoA synthase [Citrus sinensis]|uniref:elongation of fatty acids protein 3-like n=1 Tax=Citrus sinensis TaxID=2711 RepID=UPI00219A0B80|nr:elongation of fatty acids protein 3-like [Citrus sinensis]KAH9685780.1 Very-long-chain 3-oxoacyl-CoA synthase [Citrus sinensis]